MTTYIVTGIRKALSDDFTHRHIEGVCTDDRSHHALETVVDSIQAGNTWISKAGGYEKTIRVVSRCPQPGCRASPYIETSPWSLRKDNLEHLDLC